jgi:(p)ppGpp synthase/HD superfamily hydrolase
MVAQHTALEMPQYFRTDIIITSLLHDTIEDTALTKTMIDSIFGSQVANQVEDLTKVKVDRKISAEETVELLWLQKKYDVLIIKLFDRIHNVQTIGVKSPEKLRR